MFEAVPDDAIVADLPYFFLPWNERKVAVGNRILRDAAAERGLTVVPLHETMRRQGLHGIFTQFAEDLFHPNDHGYRVWASAFLPAVTELVVARASRAGAAGATATSVGAAISACTLAVRRQVRQHALPRGTTTRCPTPGTISTRASGRRLLVPGGVRVAGQRIPLPVDDQRLRRDVADSRSPTGARCSSGCRPRRRADPAGTHPAASGRDGRAHRARRARADIDRRCAERVERHLAVLVGGRDRIRLRLQHLGELARSPRPEPAWRAGRTAPAAAGSIHGTCLVGGGRRDDRRRDPRGPDGARPAASAIRPPADHPTTPTVAAGGRRRSAHSSRLIARRYSAMSSAGCVMLGQIPGGSGSLEP